MLFDVNLFVYSMLLTYSECKRKHQAVKPGV